ncbi:MgtC/SapB family protein [Luteolibacter sp. AS25]|uniref:MgtC/SapB family protein n=1 Tax=Luteolibacter sp. AS25 TaxID=3135776 RepID=UPI00398AB82E
MEWVSEFTDLGLITLAALLAGLVGLERESDGKPAGFRTHMIIGGAAALLVVCGKWLVNSGIFERSGSAMNYDPIRIMEAVIVGVSFIGAGTILKTPEKEEGARVKYLTTAASLLFSAGLGICVAIERFIIAVGVTILILIINRTLGKFNFPNKGE